MCGGSANKLKFAFYFYDSFFLSQQKYLKYTRTSEKS